MILMLPYLKKALSFAKKAVLVIIVYAVVINLFFYFTATDSPKQKPVDPVQQSRQEIYKNINDPKLNATKEGKLAVSIYRSVMCGLVGEACTDNPHDGDKNFNRSFFGFVTGVITLPYTHPPASGIAWVHDSLQKAGFIPRSYAAEGIGFASIKPFQKLWLGFRNFAYMALVIVLVTIGFLIMFRIKINPQTVISIENALPRFIIILIFITFSFAIAGFMIDLMYVVSGIIIFILAQSATSAGISGFDQRGLTNAYIGGGPINILGKILGADKWDGNLTNLFRHLPNAFQSFLGPHLTWTIRSIAGLFVAVLIASKKIDSLSGGGLGLFGFLQGIVTGGITTTAGAVFKLFSLAIVTGGLTIVAFNLIIGVIIFITVLTIFFRIIIFLVKTYIKILLLIIFSPLYLLAGTVPGQKALTLAGWIRSLVAELIVFPILIALFIVGSFITQIARENQYIFTPPFTFGVRPDTLAILLGFGVLFMTPAFLKGVQKRILPKEEGLIPSVGPGLFFGGAGAAVGGTFGLASKYTGFAYQARFLPASIRKRLQGISLLKNFIGDDSVK